MFQIVGLGFNKCNLTGYYFSDVFFEPNFKMAVIWHDMTKLTLFLLEIIRKFFFQPWGLQIPRGFHRSLWAFRAILWIKRTIIEEFSIKTPVFSFLRFFKSVTLLENIIEASWNTFEKTKLSKRVFKSIKNGNFWQKRKFSD